MGIIKSSEIIALGAFDATSGGGGGVDENRIIIKSDTIPAASEDTYKKIYIYAGETNFTYHHGYIYECKGTPTAIDISPIDIPSGEMFFDYEGTTDPAYSDNIGDWSSDAEAMQAFLELVLKNTNHTFEEVTNGTLTYVDATNHLWQVTVKDKKGNVLKSNYQLYDGDLAYFGWIFAHQQSGYTLNEPIEFSFKWRSIVVEDLHWERINVQPSSAEEVALLSITTAPSGPFAIMSKYYNSTDKKIYTATQKNTWTDAIVEDPSFNAIYIYNSTAYIWDGNSLELFELEEYQRKLVSGVNIKSINGNSILGSGNLAITTYQPFNSTWPTNTTFAAFLSAVNSDTTATAGMAYLGELSCSGLPMQGNVEATVEIQNGPGGNKTIYTVITSGTDAPYRWEYTYWNNGSNVSGWISFQPELPTQSGHSGEFLTTDGSTLSWAPSSASPSSATWYTNNTGTTITILDTTNYNFVEVYKNGLLLEYGQDYTISGTTLTLASALVSDDKIAVKVNDLSSVQLDGIEALLHNINSGDNE